MKPSETKLLRARSFRVAGVIMLILCTIALLATRTHAQAFTVLYNFGANSGDPSGAEGLLAQGRDGNLYGMSYTGGAYNLGTIFMITPAGTLTVLYNFDGTHGASPWGGLMLGTDGKFYGTPRLPGSSGDGTVFKYPPPEI